jgi:hypothetical protein
VIDYQAEAFVLQAYEFTNRSRNQQYARKQVRPNLRHNVRIGFSIWVSIFIRGRRTGVPMCRLVSTEEEHTSTLQTLNTRIGIEGIRTVRRGAVGRGELAWIENISNCEVSSHGIVDISHDAEFVLLPDEIVVHGRVGGRKRLHDYLNLVRRNVVRELESVQSIADIGKDDGIANVGPFVHLSNGHITIRDAFILIELVRGITWLEVVA